MSREPALSLPRPEDESHLGAEELAQEHAKEAVPPVRSLELSTQPDSLRPTNSALLLDAEKGEPSAFPTLSPSADLPFVVVNPASSNNSTRRRWPQLHKAMEEVLGKVEVAMTTRPMEAADLARNALLAGHRNIVAVGGDGTLNEVLNGFFDEQGQPIAPDATLSLLPRGTGGDFRRSIDFSPKWRESLAQLATAKERVVDVGRVRFVDHQGQTAVRYFLNIASFGVSGVVDEEVSRGSKWMGGRLSFAWASFKALARYRDRQVEIRVDDGPSESVSVTSLAVCKGKYFGGGMMVAPSAELDSGKFAFTLWSGYGLLDFIFKSSAIYSGKHVNLSGTRTFSGLKLEASSSERVLLDVDGEQPGLLPASFEILPKALRLRC